MANSSCSHWWRAPFYLAMSLTLAFIAIATIKHSRPDNPLPPGYGLALNASRALRLRGGFHIIATLLQISPDLFFPGPQSTVFDIQDSAISNLSVPPWAMRQLLHYHTIPATLSMAELIKKPPAFCFKTLVDNKNLVISKNDGEAGSIMINNVLVSHPDMFLEGPVAVHGVVGSFDMIPPPLCRFSNKSNILARKNATYQAVEWIKIVRLLSSDGFVSFAIGLNAALDGILQDYTNLGSVTIFAPPNSGFISSPSPFLDKIVRLHILAQRCSYMELAAENSSLTTLVPGTYLKIDKFSQILAINGVEITRPNMFSFKNFVIHGISRDFDLEHLYYIQIVPLLLV